MSEKPIALVVDDDNDWLDILEKALQPDFRVRRAKTLTDVINILESKDIKIEIALVDIRLNEEKKGDKTGLDVIFSLRKAKIPCIATTSYNNGDIVRTAWLVGRANDMWFKSEDTVLLKERIEKVKTRIEEDRKSAIEAINFNGEFWKLILLIPFAVVAFFGLMVRLLHDDYFIIIGSAVGLITIEYGFLALFYNKITGEQLIDLIRIGRKKN